MPDCVGEGAAVAALAMVGVGMGMGDKGVVLGGDASMVDVRVDIMVDRTVGMGSGEVVLVGVASVVDGMVDMGTEAGADSEPSCAGVVLEPTQ